MCNLYSQTRAVEAMRQLFAPQPLATQGTNLPPRPEIYPDQTAPVVVAEGAGLRLDMARWGLPTPAAHLRGKKTDRGVTNVRNPASPHWRPWLGPAHRCLVPFDRFAEPRPGGGNVWFRMRDDRPAFLAGLIVRGWHSVRRLAEGGVTADLFGFLTTEPNAVVGAIHPRAMPVILADPRDWQLWLTAPWPQAAALQRPLPDDLLLIEDSGPGAASPVSG